MERVADDHGLDVRIELLGELVEDGLLDVYTRAGAARLPVVEAGRITLVQWYRGGNIDSQDAERRPLDGLIEVRVVEDDIGRLAAEFEGDLGIHRQTTSVARSTFEKLH